MKYATKLFFSIAMSMSLTFTPQLSYANQQPDYSNYSEEDFKNAISQMSKEELTDLLNQLRLIVATLQEDFDAAVIQDDGRLSVKVRNTSLVGFPVGLAVWLLGMGIDAKWPSIDGAPGTMAGFIIGAGIVVISAVTLVGSQIIIIITPEEADKVQHKLESLKLKVDKIKKQIKST